MHNERLVQLCRNLLGELTRDPQLLDGSDPAMLLADFVTFVSDGAQRGAGRQDAVDALRSAIDEMGYDPDELRECRTSTIENGRIVVE